MLPNYAVLKNMRKLITFVSLRKKWEFLDKKVKR